MFSFGRLAVIIFILKVTFSEISSSETHSKTKNIFDIGETGVVPCHFPNISANFHKISRIKFFKAGVKNIYTIDMEDMEVLSETTSQKYVAHISPYPPADLFLNINNLQISDSTKYTCNLVFSDGLNETLSSTVNVKHPPKQPLVQCNGEMVSRVCLINPDDGLHLSCSNMGGFPRPKLQWLRDYRRTKHGTNNSTISRLDLHLTSDETPENGTLFTCKAVQGSLEESTTLKIFVKRQELEAENVSLITASTTSKTLSSTYATERSSPSTFAASTTTSKMSNIPSSKEYNRKRINKTNSETQPYEEDSFSSWTILVVVTTTLITLCGVLVMCYRRPCNSSKNMQGQSTIQTDWKQIDEKKNNLIGKVDKLEQEMNHLDFSSCAVSLSFCSESSESNNYTRVETPV